MALAPRTITVYCPHCKEEIDLPLTVRALYLDWPNGPTVSALVRVGEVPHHCANVPSGRVEPAAPPHPSNQDQPTEEGSL